MDKLYLCYAAKQRLLLISPCYCYGEQYTLGGGQGPDIAP